MSIVLPAVNVNGELQFGFMNNTDYVHRHPPHYPEDVSEGHWVWCVSPREF